VGDRTRRTLGLATNKLFWRPAGREQITPHWPERPVRAPKQCRRLEFVQGVSCLSRVDHRLQQHALPTAKASE
jgi:hypothetical protein